MTMKANIIATAALAFCLAGCGSMGANTSMYSTNQPVVERTNYAIDVNVAGYDGVSMTERQRVAEWFEALQLGFGDRIALDYGDAPASAIARQQINDLATEHGMLVVDTAPVTAGQIAPGTARIVVTRSSASVPNCPNWEKPNDANFNSANHPNYGCAVNSNMAAMVADPEDLVRGRKSRMNKDLGAGIPPKTGNTTGGN
jgi:pilus assembly protein CpaD